MAAVDEQRSTSYWVHVAPGTVRWGFALVGAGAHAVLGYYFTQILGLQSGPGVSTFYFPILLIVLFVSMLGFPGVVAAAGGAFLRSLMAGQPWGWAALWSLGDGIQALILWRVVRGIGWLGLIDELHRHQARKDTILLWLLALGLLPALFIVVAPPEALVMRSVIAGIMLVVFVIIHFKSRPVDVVVPYLAGILIGPSLVGAVYTTFLSRTAIATGTPPPSGTFVETVIGPIIVWLTGNFVVLGGILTPFAYALTKPLKGILQRATGAEAEHGQRVETVVYFLALLVWVVLHVVAVNTGLLKPARAVDVFQLFPFLMGIGFLLANMYGSMLEELGPSKTTAEGKETTPFDTLESRVIVVETNTQTMLQLLSFLLPLVTLVFKDELAVAPKALIPALALATVSAACAIVILWVPRPEIRVLRLLKAAKTVLHIYTVAGILTAAVLVLGLGP